MKSHFHLAFRLQQNEQPVHAIELENSLNQIKNIMQTQPNWSDWFTNHTSNDAGNKKMQAYSDILSSTDSDFEKLRSLVKDIDTVFLAADKTRNVMIFHSPKKLPRVLDTKTK